jgi:radical SAM protein with 4Fe4S-binding SPASM domain
MDRRFHKINIEISNICNYQCSFCPEVIRSKHLMRLPLFEKVIDQAAPLTEQVTFHLMGEPLLHPDLARMLDLCGERKVPVFMVSNGALLTETRAELLLHPTIRQVNFSVHSFSNNHPGEDPEPYLRKIFSFTRTAFERRPDLYINYRLWNLDGPESDHQTNGTIRRLIEKEFGLEIPGVGDVRKQKSHRLLNRLYIHCDTEFVWPDPSLPELGSRGTCMGLRNHIGILADGTVVPCCLDKEGRIPLGNIDESPLIEILETPKAREMLEGFLARKLTDPLCRRCQYVTRFS